VGCGHASLRRAAGFVATACLVLAEGRDPDGRWTTVHVEPQVRTLSARHTAGPRTASPCEELVVAPPTRWVYATSAAYNTDADVRVPVLYVALYVRVRLLPAPSLFV